MNLITKTFNAYCSELGVQCTATMNPSDWRQLLHFKNVGDRKVKITHRGESRLILPGEHVTLGSKEWYSLVQDGLPTVEAIDPDQGYVQADSHHEQEEHLVENENRQ